MQYKLKKIKDENDAHFSSIKSVLGDDVTFTRFTLFKGKSASFARLGPGFLFD